MKKTVDTVFPAFNQRNYRIYFTGQLISLIGTWLHIVAEGWLVLQITKSAFWVGAISALHLLPLLLFSIVAGAYVDRHSNKKILYVTQFGALVCAVTMGVLTLTDTIALWNLAILVFGMGLCQAFDLPARQSFMTELVEKKYLSSALAINSGMFNGARAIGPAIAGILIVIFGVGGLFVLNGLSFIAGIISVYLIDRVKHLPRDTTHPFTAIKKGLAYTFSHPNLSSLLMLVGITAICGWSYGTMFPVIVQSIYHKGAESLGYFHAAVGAGAVIGAIAVSGFSRNLPVKLFVFGGTAIIAVSIVAFTLAPSLTLVYASLFILGTVLVLQFSTINTLLHHEIVDTMRGRVMGIFTFMSAGLMPIGSFQTGVIAEALSPYWALRINAGILLLAGFIIYLIYSKKITPAAH